MCCRKLNMYLILVRLPCRQTSKKRSGDQLIRGVVKIHTREKVSRDMDAALGQRQLTVSATHYNTAYGRASPAADSGLDPENALQARGISISLAVSAWKPLSMNHVYHILDGYGSIEAQYFAFRCYAPQPPPSPAASLLVDP